MKNDTEQLRQLFEASPNTIIPLKPTILSLQISQYGRCIHDLRGEGYDIESVYLGKAETGKRRTGFIYHNPSRQKSKKPEPDNATVAESMKYPYQAKFAFAL